MLLKSQARHVQHMQKALTQMNIQLANVISDVMGETGQKILRAIVAGERDGQVLGSMKNVRIRASVEEIAKSLHGNWRAEHLFALKQALALFDFIGTQLAGCDREIGAAVAKPAGSRRRTGQRQEAGPRAQRAQVRSSRAAVQDVRRGPHAHRRHRRDNRAGGGLGDRRGHVTLPHHQALHLLAGLVPGDQDHRRQAAQWQDQALRQSRGPGSAAWQPLRCAAANRLWARTSAGWPHAWTNQRPSPLPLTNSLA